MRGRKRKNGRTEGLIGKIFILVLLLAAVVNLIVPDRESSDAENRVLASMPKLNWSTIATGDFAEQFENYLSDQFMARDLLRGTKVTADRIGGSRMENGV